MVEVPLSSIAQISSKRHKPPQKTVRFSVIENKLPNKQTNGSRRIRTLVMAAFENAESGQKQWKAENDPKVEELNTTKEDFLNQLDFLNNDNNERGIVLHQLRLCHESLKKTRRATCLGNNCEDSEDCTYYDPKS